MKLKRALAFAGLVGYQFHCALPITEPVVTKRDYQAGTITTQLEGMLAEDSGCTPKYESREQIRQRLLAKLECSNFEILADGEFTESRSRTTTTVTPTGSAGYGQPGVGVPNYGYGGAGQPGYGQPGGSSVQTQTVHYQVPFYWLTYKCVAPKQLANPEPASSSSSSSRSVAAKEPEGVKAKPADEVVVAPKAQQQPDTRVQKQPEPTRTERSLPVTSTSTDSDAAIVEPVARISWERCHTGQRLENGQCVEKAGSVTWSGARKYCEALGLLAKRWRLPSVSEFKQLYAWNRKTEKESGKAPLSALRDPYWTSEAYEGSPDVGMAFDLTSGDVFAYNGTTPAAVRCVSDR